MKLFQKQFTNSQLQISNFHEFFGRFNQTAFVRRQPDYMIGSKNRGHSKFVIGNSWNHVMSKYKKYKIMTSIIARGDRWRVLLTVPWHYQNAGIIRGRVLNEEIRYLCLYESIPKPQSEWNNLKWLILRFHNRYYLLILNRI